MAEARRQLEIPPRGTRGRRVVDVLFKILGPLAGTRISRYRKRSSRELPMLNGMPLVLLTTIGARTGLQRTSELGGFRENDDSWLIIGSKGGSITHPAWFINLCKNPDKVWLEVGTRKFHARPVLLQGEEYEAAYARIVAVSPGYRGYRKVTDRHIPLVRLTPVS